MKALSFYFFLSFCSSLSNLYCSSTGILRKMRNPTLDKKIIPAYNAIKRE